jgi:Flp pilus assembly protein TadG
MTRNNALKNKFCLNNAIKMETMGKKGNKTMIMNANLSWSLSKNSNKN